MLYYPLPEYKPKPIRHDERIYDQEGRPFPIEDDDLEEIFSRSDFAIEED